MGRSSARRLHRWNAAPPPGPILGCEPIELTSSRILIAREAVQLYQDTSSPPDFRLRYPSSHAIINQDLQADFGDGSSPQQPAAIGRISEHNPVRANTTEGSRHDEADPACLPGAFARADKKQ
jgi:hypothetical protein